MSLTREDMLRELELLPAWRLRNAEDVAQASPPAKTEKTDLLQGEHNRGYLPHLKVEGGVYFVTFRLADSLPASVLAQWEALPETDKTREVEAWLDAGHGACLLAQPACAEIVHRALLHGNTEKYRLHAWVIMPNHVHLVVEPLSGHPLSDILQGIKSCSAHEINQHSGGSGAVWQRESYDHLVRDDEDLARCCEYVRQNPVKAGLVAAVADYRFGDAGVAVNAGEDACATEGPPISRRDKAATRPEPLHPVHARQH